MIYPVNLYEGPTRSFLGQQPPVGTVPSAGGTLYGLMAPLHFGHFAGLASKAVWGALGVATCFVILSGFRLWVRRRAADPAWRRFGRAVQIVGYGLPIGMLSAAYGSFLARPAGDPFHWTPWSFVIGAVAAILFGQAADDDDRLGRDYQRIAGFACLGLPVVRLATGGMDWAEALIARQFDVLSVDLVFLAAGASLLLHARRRTPRRRRRPLPEPAA